MGRILVTSAIPYINGIKHLGNLIGSQLPADLYARYMRARGHEVLFLCATDEHGTPAEIAAAKANENIEHFCARMHKAQSEIAAGFCLSFDHFGRSSSPQNHKLTQYFAGALRAGGFIKEITEQQMFSHDDNRFLPDRYIEGTCPSCGYENARGDQCENCTKQLNPRDLINPRSAISGKSNIVPMETTHLYLRQSALKDKIAEWIDAQKDWPLLTTSIARKWLYDGNGLRDRGITRDLNWGIPVKDGEKEWPGMENKVFYVWFDAPIEYIACAGEWAQENGLNNAAWQRWWRKDKGADDVYYVQFMGKDNVPFHTLGFPATLMGVNANADDGTEWKLVDYIKSFNYLTYEGGQFSTSAKRGIFQDKALELMPADYWRWWLLANAPESADSAFTWDAFQSCINKDLAHILGNFVNRLTKFCIAKFGAQVPQGNEEYYHAQKDALWEKIAPVLAEYSAMMEAIEIRKSAHLLRMLWSFGNQYLQDSAPWAVLKESPDNAAAIVRLGLNLIPFYASLSAPFIPQSAAYLHEIFQTRQGGWCDDKAALSLLQPNHEFTEPRQLFAQIDNETIDKWKAQFAGS